MIGIGVSPGGHTAEAFLPQAECVGVAFDEEGGGIVGGFKIERTGFETERLSV